MKDGKPYAVFCAVNMKTRKIALLFGNDAAWIYDEQAQILVAGTGRLAAKRKWDETHNAFEALEEAKNQDARTGGKTKYVNIDTGENNLSGNWRPSYAFKKLVRENGIVMYDLQGSKEYTINKELHNYSQILAILSEYEAQAIVEEKKSSRFFYKKEIWLEPYKTEVTEALKKICPERFS
ncbi:hypothetical protein A0U94_05285 [Gluconobacter albidus]|nr:hypothetical protein A0U94_05285 [Gluconobacter albidus]